MYLLSCKERYRIVSTYGQQQEPPHIQMISHPLGKGPGNSTHCILELHWLAAAVVSVCLVTQDAMHNCRMAREQPPTTTGVGSGERASGRANQGCKIARYSVTVIGIIFGGCVDYGVAGVGEPDDPGAILLAVQRVGVSAPAPKKPPKTKQCETQQKPHAKASGHPSRAAAAAAAPAVVMEEKDTHVRRTFSSATGCTASDLAGLQTDRGGQPPARAGNRAPHVGPNEREEWTKRARASGSGA